MSDDVSDVFGVSASEVLDSGAVRKRKSQVSPFLLEGGAEDEFHFSLATASGVHASVVNMAGAEASSLGRMAGPSASTSPEAAASASLSVSHISRRHLALHFGGCGARKKSGEKEKNRRDEGLSCHMYDALFIDFLNTARRERAAEARAEADRQRQHQLLE